MSTAATLEYRVLGPVEARLADTTLPLGGPRHRRLLAVLLLRADEVVPVGELTEALWGDRPPRSAPEMVHVRISELRAALRLGNPELVTHTGGYRLCVAPGALDTHRFETLVRSAAGTLADGAPARARDELDAALALWHGPAVAEFATEPFAEAEVVRLEALRLTALEYRFTADLALGRHADVVAELTALTTKHPLHEPFTGLLMRALQGSGRSAEALEAYASLRRVLAEELGVNPSPALQRLHVEMLREPVRGNLPAAYTSFVGRRADLAALPDLLRRTRLVTLTGVGGAGKSRLAVEVALACRDDVPGGAWLVELAPVERPEHVAGAIAAALGVREQRLTTHLGRAATLLVLDNCEHLVAGVAAVADRLLRACPDLRILATSRERLGVTGEHLHPVAGLDVTGDAVRLFVSRVAAVRPGYRVTAADAAAVDRICRQLDGLPLALELAAAVTTAIDLPEVAARLDDRFALLTRGSPAASARHQTLRATVDWSYQLLDTPQRTLFEQLAVFVGGFTIEAAQAVAGEPSTVSLLTDLVDKSLVTVGDRRYQLPETLRVFGLERLDASGIADEVRDRHAAYLLRMVRSIRRALHGAEQSALIRRLETEHGNLRAALDWSLARGDTGTAIRLAGSLYPLWDQHGHYREGRDTLDQVLTMPGDVPPIVRARALDSVAGLAVLQGDLDRAAEAAAEAASLSRAADDKAGLARALTTAGLTAIYADRLDKAEEVLEDAIDIARAAEAPWPEGFAQIYLACVAIAHGDMAAARAWGEAAEAPLRVIGDPEGLSGTLVIRGFTAWRLGERAAGEKMLEAGVRGFTEVDHRWGRSLGLFLVAVLAADRGEHERVAFLLGVAEALRGTIGTALMPFVRRVRDVLLARAQAALTADAFIRAWDAGRAEALDKDPGRVSSYRPGHAW
ncbi:ATP-binding protein [Cryptosporangium aurantiacum]|uniref:Predicted ATPase n=1 Tax=Cryptosporangium aurantiacum TaxID=134849 RepID=A0A1M7RJQ3_9ACTN|nr:BTAD domain-containing putative transcriptional regulator [Cryptosporangium aurantiacum]SHN46575.1 Predicted ATPase [Cryptosporangium aurantiacum]